MVKSDTPSSSSSPPSPSPLPTEPTQTDKKIKIIRKHILTATDTQNNDKKIYIICKNFNDAFNKSKDLLPERYKYISFRSSIPDLRRFTEFKITDKLWVLLLPILVYDIYSSVFDLMMS